MTNLEFIQSNIAWAKSYLAKPESELPGTLTHAKCAAVLEENEDALIDHLGVTLDRRGNWALCYIDGEAA